MLCTLEGQRGWSYCFLHGHLWTMWELFPCWPTMCPVCLQTLPPLMISELYQVRKFPPAGKPLAAMSGAMWGWTGLGLAPRVPWAPGGKGRPLSAWDIWPQVYPAQGFIKEREGHILPLCSLEYTHSMALLIKPGFQCSTQRKAHGARQTYLVAKGTEGSHVFSHNRNTGMSVLNQAAAGQAAGWGSQPLKRSRIRSGFIQKGSFCFLFRVGSLWQDPARWQREVTFTHSGKLNSLKKYLPCP